MKLLVHLLGPQSVLLALGAPLAAQGQVHTVDDGKRDYGAAWQLDLDTDGGVEEQLAIADGLGGFEGVLYDFDAFGSVLAAIGDLDGDGTTDLAVGAKGDDTGGNSRGAVWILFRALDGTVASERAIRSGEVPLVGQDQLGSALAFLGDLDGDGRPELAAGAPGSAVGGGIWILSLETDGSVAQSTLVAEGQGGFTGNLDSGDGLGQSLAAIGDLDGDGVSDLAAGAPNDDDGGQDSGALWILFLNPDGTVKAELKISRTSGGFGSGGLNLDKMGTSVCALGDLDDDGVVDLALGATLGGQSSETGGVWILFLNADGSVRAKQRISTTSGGLSNPDQYVFGSAVAPLGDLDGDGLEDLAVGASQTGAGAVFVLNLNADGTVAAQTRLENALQGLASGDQFGASLADLGDLDGDGRVDLGVGSPNRDGVNDADFTSLQTAVNSAAAGDTLLVRPGFYDTTTVSAKTLTIVGDVPDRIGIDGLRVQNLAASQRVALARLHVESPTISGPPVQLTNNAGIVWIDECVTEVGFLERAPGLRATACAAVVVNRSSFRGSTFGSVGGPLIAPPGVSLLDASALHAYDCTFAGADGAGNSGEPATTAQRGGAGIESTSAGNFVFLSRCTVQGGDGIYYDLAFSTPSCSAGGPGLQTVSQAVVLDCVLAGGEGGHNGPNQCAADGAASTGPVDFLAGEGLSFTTSQLAREREDITWTFRGPPHTAVYLAGSPVPRAQFFPNLRGSLLTGTPRAIEFLGFTDAAGTLEVVRELGLLPEGQDVRRLFLQPYYFVPTSPALRQLGQIGHATLGAGLLFLTLDESF